MLIGERQPLAPGAAAPGDAVIERSLRRAIVLNPQPAEPYGQLGWLLAQSSRTLREAEALIDEALARAPAHEMFNLVDRTRQKYCNYAIRCEGSA